MEAVDPNGSWNSGDEELAYSTAVESKGVYDTWKEKPEYRETEFPSSDPERETKEGCPISCEGCRN